MLCAVDTADIVIIIWSSLVVISVVTTIILCYCMQYHGAQHEHRNTSALAGGTNVIQCLGLNSVENKNH